MSQDPSSIQYHPPHKSAAGYGFEDGERVPITAPEMFAGKAPELELFLRLKETGAVFPNPDAALTVIAASLDVAGYICAGDALAQILAGLDGGGRRGAELRAALLGTVDGDGAAMAKKYGISKQAWGQLVKRLRRRIFKKSVYRSPIGRDTN